MDASIDLRTWGGGGGGEWFETSFVDFLQTKLTL